MNLSENTSVIPDANSSMPPPGPPPGFMGEPPPGYYFNVTTEIWTYVPPFIISIGTVGNVLTIIVIFRQIIRRILSPTSLFLLCLAFSDLLVLYTGPLRQWILHNEDWNKTDIRNEDDASCRIHTFLTYSSIHFSSWLLVAVTLERVLSVIMPHRIKAISTVKVAAIAIVSTAGVLILLNGHFLFGIGYGYVREQSAQQGRDVYHPCWPKTSKYQEFSDDVWPWIDFLVAFAVPFIVLTTCNIIIIVRLTLTRRHRRRMSLGQGHTLRSIDRDNNVVTVLLICLCVLFFICLAPVSIYFIGQPYWITEITSRSITSQQEALQARADMEYLIFWHAVVNCVGYLNATCNFIFYVLSGSKFRREIFGLFCCRKPGLESVFGSSTRSSSISSISKKSSRPSVDTTVSKLSMSSATVASTPAVAMGTISNGYTENFESAEIDDSISISKKSSRPSVDTTVSHSSKSSAEEGESSAVAMETTADDSTEKNYESTEIETASQISNDLSQLLADDTVSQLSKSSAKIAEPPAIDIGTAASAYTEKNYESSETVISSRL